MGRTRTARTLGPACTVLAVLLSVLPAAAQEENGVKMGSGRLHPSLEVEGHYDSLALIAEQGSAGDLILHFRPGLKLDLPSPAFAVQLNGQADYNLYTGIINPSSRRLSYLGGDALLDVNINQDGPVGVRLGDRFQFSDRISAIGLGAGVRSAFNEAYGSIPIRPGGGALVFEPGYAFAFEAFFALLAQPAGVNPQSLNYISHRPSLLAKWHFLPKTAVVLDVRSDLRIYGRNQGNPGVNALYAQTGLSGLITPKLSLSLLAGYGNAFVDPTSGVANYESVIGQADLGWFVTESGKLKIGYLRTFQPVPQFGWYGNNRVYVGSSFQFAGRLTWALDGSLDFVDYATGRSDFLARIDTSFDFRVTGWLHLAVGYRFNLRIAGEAAGATDPGFDYNRHEGWGRLVLVY
ncbi:MAG: hypothetical protein D6729_10765 [Deltaproteobacteria bacterium]|nr:MAG: hypothetical protein D6729_10765 [Deltaproteobacteria bacterium]